ncbi:5-hydroxyisourate hydrolase-like isoform X1 [Narcine bancroftii]|uniref:5-hydroxyisourate hydrolase-like isoform X1 n=1 Tax=Narcine bancroftii TaxID=1343680 RepID=UPI0038319D1A
MTAPRLQHIQHHLVARKCNCQERNMSESVLTTHILNTTQGIPAARLAVCVSRLENEQWKEMARGVTNSDGRCPGLFTSQTFTPGIYKMKFATNEYWQSLKVTSFYPYIELELLRRVKMLTNCLTGSYISFSSCFLDCLQRFRYKSEVPYCSTHEPILLYHLPRILNGVIKAIMDCASSFTSLSLVKTLCQILCNKTRKR